MAKDIPKVQISKEGIKVPTVVQHDAFIYYGGLFAAIDFLRHQDGSSYAAGNINRETQYGRRLEKAVRYLIHSIGPVNYRSASFNDNLLDPACFWPAKDPSTIDLTDRHHELTKPSDTTVALISRVEQSGLVAVHRVVNSWDLVDGTPKPAEVQYLATIQMPGSFTQSQS